MPVFMPKTAFRAQIDSSPVRNGQLIIAVDTGEVFFDFNGSRIALLGGEGGGQVPAAGPEATDYAVVNAALLRSPSLSGGGAGYGLINAPEVTIPDSDTDSVTAYPIV